MKRVLLAWGVLMAAVALLGPEPVQGQQWKYVAMVISDASKGESALLVELVAPCQEGRDILIENREGTYRERHYVRHVYGRHVILGAGLQQEFLTGSKVYQ